MSLRSPLALIVALSLALPAAALAADFKVAYVDYQRVLLEVEDGKAAKARLEKWLLGRQKEIDSEQEKLRQEKEALEKQKDALSEETFNQRAMDLQKKVYELAQKWERSRMEAADKERKEMEPIAKRIDEIIARIAEREGLSMVFDKRDSGLVYALSHFDLTLEVIRSYTSAAPKGQPKDVPTRDTPKDAPKK
jgi:outer membrane protein